MTTYTGEVDIIRLLLLVKVELSAKWQNRLTLHTKLLLTTTTTKSFLPEK